MKVTEKEYIFLKNIEGNWQSRESDDGKLSMFVSNDELIPNIYIEPEYQFIFDMKIARGIMGSLVKKKIITSELYEKSHINDNDVYFVKVNKEYGSNYKLINLEVA